MNQIELYHKLEYLYQKYNHKSFIQEDPILIPHRFKDVKNIEIMGFWVAMLAWGQRKTIIKKANELIKLMDGNPFDFIINHKQSDLKRFEQFKHRTFNPTDTLYFLHFFQKHYTKYDSLECAFNFHPNEDLKVNLMAFHQYFFQDELAPLRTKKHVSTPAKNSACKRLCMFLRWMVRKDDNGVDFGIWKTIPTDKLMIPLDVHVFRIATQWGLLKTNKVNWKAVVELTNRLRTLDPNDPVKYDYAIFGFAIDQKRKKEKIL